MGNETSPTFWKRQFHPPATDPQIIFDVIFGIIAPILCLIADPIVFIKGEGSLSGYVIIAYTSIAIEIAFLLLRLINSERISFINLIVSGPLLLGAFVSTVIGIVILPLSIPGLFAIIGIFGFTPFLTAFVFWRNGICALKSSGNYNVAAKYLVSFLLIPLVIFTPYYVNTWVKNTVSESIIGFLTGNEVEKIDNEIRLVTAAKYINISNFANNQARKQIRDSTLHFLIGNEQEKSVIKPQLERLDEFIKLKPFIKDIMSTLIPNIKEILLGDDDAKIAQVVSELKHFYEISKVIDTYDLEYISVDFIAWEYDKTPDASKRQKLKEVYHDITGEDINARIMRLKD